MIISDYYKYLFVELARTGTTAISKELIKNYEGKNILHKHATYKNFLKVATDEQKKYFVFSCIRNPIDRIVSFYVKCAQGFYDYKFEQSNLRLYEKYYLIPRVKFIKSHNPSFDDYLFKFHKWPYVDWSVLDHKKFDFVIKFENLNNDFQSVLKLMNIEPKRDLPKINVTTEKKSFDEYLSRDHAQLYAKIFGPAIYKMGYSLPFETDTSKIYYKQKLNNTMLKYNILKFLKTIYWMNFK